MQLTQDQILQLAPDAASAKAGAQLATTAKWTQRNAHPAALWGDCQGSGSKPYLTMVDLGNMAFKCSCPSRKFPCKHGLGLLLLYAAQANSFTQQASLSPSVEEWLNKRSAKAEAKEVVAAKPVDEKAQQKRVEAREKKVENGILGLRQWLQDLVRAGILDVPQNAYQLSQSIIARMVDAQAPGIAGSLRRLPKINYYKAGWELLFLKEITAIYGLTEAYQNREQLSETWQQDVRQRIGWNIAKEEVLQGETMTDEWQVLSKTVEEEGNLRIQTVWLYGLQNQRFALLLDFFVGAAIPELLIVPGTTIQADLAFFPNVQGFRALVKEKRGDVGKVQPPMADLNIEALLDQVAASYGSNPFVDQIPFLMREMQLSRQGDQWLLCDALGKGILLHNSAAEIWQILAATGGNAFACFGLYTAEGLDVLGFWHGTQYFSIR